MKAPVAALSAGLDGNDHMCVNKPQIFWIAALVSVF